MFSFSLGYSFSDDVSFIKIYAELNKLSNIDNKDNQCC